MCEQKRFQISYHHHHHHCLLCLGLPQRQPRQRDLRVRNCESAVCVRIEYFQLQRISSIKISNHKWSKRDMPNNIFLITILEHIKLPGPGVWSLMELASLYTVPLSAVNGWSHLTKLTTSKQQARPIRFENFRIGQSLSNRIRRPIRIWIKSRSFAGP